MKLMLLVACLMLTKRDVDEVKTVVSDFRRTG